MRIPTDSGKERPDADPHPHEHERRRLTDSDPARLLEKLRAANQGGDVHPGGSVEIVYACDA